VPTVITQTAVYIVPLDALKRAVGSRSAKLLKAIKKSSAKLLTEADENRADDIERTCGEALADLINGADYDEVPEEEAHLYGLALEALCAHLGAYAGEVDGDWNDELDAFFAARSVPLKFSDLVFGDEVIKLPSSSDDYPIIGSWAPEQIAAAATPLRAIDLKALRAEDEELAKVVGDIIKWIKKASKHSGWGLVGFSL
jgi:hypothetical protein